MTSRVIKVVIIGPSGCGKTSLRGQYISGRFATGYRATIGTDFISKTFPLPSSSNPADLVTLQIWDTAGQERFSSLSAAFFRGADAVILVFDVNQPQTLLDLKRWWGEFKDKAPVREGEEANFCVVVVGNKMDLVDASKRAGKPVVDNLEATRFLKELIPLTHVEGEQPSPPGTPAAERELDLASLASPPPPHWTVTNGAIGMSPSSTSTIGTALPRMGLPTIANLNSPPPDRQLAFTVPPHLRNQGSSSKTKYGTMTTVNTSTFSVYHTPPSSIHRYPSQANAGYDGLSPPISTELDADNSGDSNNNPIFDLFRNFKLDYSMSERPRGVPTHTNSGDVDMSSTIDDLDFDFDYATAMSSPVPSACTSRQSSVGPSAMRRPRIRGFDSSSSLNTIKPREMEPLSVAALALNSGEGFGTSITQGILPVDPLTPSASPPSPPKLTASLIATLDHPQPSLPNGLDIGPRLFFASAKTGGQAVTDPFEYVARRVVARLEWEETMAAEDEARERSRLIDDTFVDRRGYRQRLSGFKLGETLRGHLNGAFGRGSCCQI